MKIASILGASALVLGATAHRHQNSHNHLHALEKKHNELHVRATQEADPVVKRGGQCQLPDDPNIVRVPGQKNGGWALSPDRACEPGMYCPIACKPGMVMNQWKKSSTFSIGSSTEGGLYCNDNGEIEKPFEGEPNCVPGTGNVEAVNKCGQVLSFCQTILPGYEEMISPSVVKDKITLAVPGPKYWQGTSAHYYVNPPGTDENQCIWGSTSKAIGNWTPYVAGTNTDNTGNTYVKLGLNPEWQKISSLSSQKPNYGLEVKCPNGGCSGLPCMINLDGKVKGQNGGDWCVVTVPKGASAQIVAFDSGDGGSGGNDDEETKEETSAPKSSPKPSPKPEPKPEPSPEPETSTSSEPELTTSSEPPPPPETTSEVPTSTYEPEPETTTAEETSTSETPTTTSSTRKFAPTYKPGIFRENKTEDATTPSFETSTSISPSTSSRASSSSSSSEQPPPEKGDEDNNAPRQNGGALGLVIAFAAAFYFL